MSSLNLNSFYNQSLGMYKNNTLRNSTSFQYSAYFTTICFCFSTFICFVFKQLWLQSCVELNKLVFKKYVLRKSSLVKILA